MRSKTTKFIDGFLKLSVGTTLAGAVFVAPMLPEAFPDALLKYLETSNKERDYRRLLRYMKNQKLIETTEDSAGFIVRVTEKGLKRYKRVEVDDLSIPVPKKWDKKWRLVMFDIPKVKQTNRLYFLDKLKSLGFYRMQDSFWVHPFPCEEQVHTIAELYEIRPYTSIAICEFHQYESLKLLRVFKDIVTD